MKNYIITICCLLATNLLFSQSTFFKTFPHERIDFIPAFGGGYYLLGSNHPGNVYTLYRLDDDGNIAWSKNHPVKHATSHHNMAIAQSADSLLWIGNRDSLYRLTPQGDVLFSMLAPSRTSSGSACQKIYVTDDKVYFFWGEGDVTCHNTQGTLLWTYLSYWWGTQRPIRDIAPYNDKIFASGDSITSNGIIGRVMKLDTAGNFLAKKSLNATVQPFSNQVRYHTILLHSNGYLYTSGEVTTGPAWNDIYVRKINQNLDTLWAKNIFDGGPNTSANCRIVDMIEIPDGNIVAAGHVSDGAFIVKFDTAGTIIWHSTLPLGVKINKIYATTSNGYMASAYTGTSTAITTGPASIIKLDSVGKLAHTLVKGNVFVDRDLDGTKDAGEVGLRNRMVTISPGNFVGLTDSLGNYEIFVPNTGVFTQSVSLPLYHNPFAPSSDSITINLPRLDSIYVNNFAIAGLPNVEDLEIYVTGSSPRALSTQPIIVQVKNVGTVTSLQPVVKLVHDAMVVPGVSNLPYTTLADTIIWQLDSLQPAQTLTLEIYFAVPNDTLGTILRYWANINIPQTDSTTENNYDEIYTTIRNSYDPNNKVSHSSTGSIEGYFTEYDPTQEYVINFQNTGNDSAYHILLVDTLDLTVLDINTFEVIGASHNYITELSTDGVLRFRFPNIYLPDSATNPLTSQGFVRFHIDALPGLAHNTPVNNTAGIFFDANPAVITNTTDNTFVLCDSTNKFILSENALCAGDTLVATYTGTGANNLYWTVASTNAGSETTIQYVAATASNLNVNLTSALGNCTHTTMQSASVTAIPVVDISVIGSAFCEGDTVTITSTAATSLWYYNGLQVGAGTELYTVHPGDYYAKATNQGCSGLSDTVSLAFSPIPAQPTVQADSNGLTASVIADTYEWFLDGVVLPATTQTIVPTGEGDYTVKAVSLGCESTLSTAYRYELVGITEAPGTVIKIFPMPNNGKFVVQLNGVPDGNASISIYSLLGEQILHQQVSTESLSFDISAHAAGTYLLQLHTQNSNTYIRVVKE